MNNNQLFPFERNRYYAGKMLSSADFGAEQSYINNKRRFLNNILFGSGIVCGCNVYNLDDLSIFIESGCAIDSMGREIIIDTSVVKKLSAIEGFEQIESNQLTLCLKYKEENVHPVYSVKRQSADNEYEYNRIREGYQLFLMETENIMHFKPETEFFVQGVLYKNADYEVIVQMPATVCKEYYVKMQVIVNKLSISNKPFSYTATLQMPSFLNKDGNHEQLICLEELNLAVGESITRDYWLFVQNVALEESLLILKGDMEDVPKSDFSMKVMLSNVLPGELIDYEIGKMSFEMQEMELTNEFICLADIRLIRTDSAYIIEHITERNVKNYIQAPAKGAERREYLGYFRENDFFADKNLEMTNSLRMPFSNYKEEKGFKIATGTLEIPVGVRAKAGNIFYSGEVMHGLGAGTVYVELGREFIEEDAVFGANVKSTVYGDAKLFEELVEKNQKVTTAIKVLNDKGSFIAAAKFEEDTECLMLTYRWVAIKFANNGIQEQKASAYGQWIEAETPTVVLGTRDEYYFGVKFHNMEKCSIGYEVTEAGGGTITLDGIYTAPNKEGVYEVRIYCMDQPFICTYAYAVVKKK